MNDIFDTLEAPKQDIFDEVAPAKSDIFDQVAEPDEYKKAAESMQKTRALVRTVQLEQARKEGERLDAGQSILSGLETGADILHRTAPWTVARSALGVASKGVGRMLGFIPGIPKTPENAPDLTQQPIVSPEQAQRAVEFLSPLGKASEGSVGQGLQKAAGEVLSATTDPAAAFSMGPVVRSPGLATPLFAAPMVESIPEAVERVKQAKDTPELIASTVGLAAQLGIPLAIAKGAKTAPLPKENAPRLLPPLRDVTEAEMAESARRAKYIAEQKAELAGELAVSESTLDRLEQEGKAPEAPKLETVEAAPAPSTEPAIDVTQPAPPAPTEQTPQPGLQESEIIGMGGAVPSEFTPTSRTATGVKNAAVDAERQSRGLSPIIAPQRLKNAVVWDRVMARIDLEPEWQDRLIDDLQQGRKTQINADEVLALDHRYVDLQNEYAKATRDGAQAYEDGRMADVEDAKTRAAFFENKLNKIEQVAKKVGTEWGRSGQMRQRLMKEDFTLAAMEARQRAAKGFEPLTEQEHAEIAELHQKLVEAERKATEAETAANERVAKAEMDKALAEARATVAQQPSYAPGVIAQAERFAKYMDKKGDEALARLKARLGRTSAGIDPTILSDAAIYGAAKLTRGLTDVAKWTDSMIADLGEWAREHINEIRAASEKVLADEQSTLEKARGKATADKIKKAITSTADERKAITEGLKEAVADEADDADIGRYARELASNFLKEEAGKGRDPKTILGNEITDAVHGILKDIIPEITTVEARDAWTQYGKFKAATSDPIRKRLIQASEEERKLSTLERLQKGEAGLRTGQQRVEQTDLSRRRTKEINELSKKLGITTSDPASQLKSTLDAIKTRNKHRIADLRFENATKTRIVKGKRVSPSDAESIAQRAEIDRLKKENDEIFGDKTLTPEQRLERAIAAAERNSVQAEAALERARKGDYGKPAGTPLPASEKLNALKSRATAIREQIAHLKNLDAALQEAKRVKEQTKQIGEIDKRIEEVTRQINEGDIEAKKTPGKSVLPELSAKRAELAELNKIKQRLRNEAKPKKTPEEIAIQSLKTRLATERAELNERLAAGDFSPRRIKRELALDPITASAKAEVNLLRERFNRGLEHERYLRKSRAEKIWMGTKEALNLSRAIMTSWDVSAVFRQGGFISLGNPVRAAKALGPMFKALLSEKNAATVEAEIAARPNAKLYAQSKLFLAPREGARLTSMEEAFMSRLASKIPGVAASGRAYVTFLNRLRADTFDALHESLTSGKTATPAELEAISNYINIATGRGNLGKAAGAAETLSTAFFAPRLVASRFQLLAGEPAYRGSAQTRYLVAKEYAKFLGGLAVVYGLGKLAGASINTDPRSTDFGKMKWGNTRVDPLAGLSQVTVLLSRLASGKMVNSKGQVEPIRGKVAFGHPTSADLIARFLRTKLSPVVGDVVDVLTGKNVVGETVTPKTVAMNAVIPLSMSDIYSVMQEQGVTAGTAIAILSLFGMSVQNYDTNKKPK